MGRHNERKRKANAVPMRPRARHSGDALATRSRNAADGRKTGTTRAGTCTGSPDCGVWNVRAARFCGRNDPKPRSSTLPPSSTAAMTVSMNPSTTASVSILVRPVASAIWSMSSLLVTAFPGKRWASNGEGGADRESKEGYGARHALHAASPVALAAPSTYLVPSPFLIKHCPLGTLCAFSMWPGK